jgi:hypothetical protein
MRKKMRLSIIYLLFSIICVEITAQTLANTTTAAGQWTDCATWGSPAGGIVNSGAQLMQINHAVTVTGMTVYTNKIQFGAGGSLSFVNGGQVSYTGSGSLLSCVTIPGTFSNFQDSSYGCGNVICTCWGPPLNSGSYIYQQVGCPAAGVSVVHSIVLNYTGGNGASYPAGSTLGVVRNCPIPSPTTPGVVTASWSAGSLAVGAGSITITFTTPGVGGAPIPKAGYNYTGGNFPINIGNINGVFAVKSIGCK